MRKWIALTVIALPLAACGPSCDATSTSSPAGRFRLDGTYSTTAGYTVNVVCDTLNGNLVYSEGNGGVFVVIQGCSR